MPVIAMWRDKIFQLYPATEGHSQSTIEYHNDVRALHNEPITDQEVQTLQGRCPSDISKLDGIAATSELFKHRDLDVNFVLHATESKRDDKFILVLYYSYFGCLPFDNYIMQQ